MTIKNYRYVGDVSDTIGDVLVIIFDDVQTQEMI